MRAERYVGRCEAAAIIFEKIPSEGMRERNSGKGGRKGKEDEKRGVRLTSLSRGGCVSECRIGSRYDRDSRGRFESTANSVDLLERNEIDHASLSPVNQMFNHFSHRRVSWFDVQQRLVFGESGMIGISRVSADIQCK